MIWLTGGASRLLEGYDLFRVHSPQNLGARGNAAIPDCDPRRQECLRHPAARPIFPNVGKKGPAFSKGWKNKAGATFCHAGNLQSLLKKDAVR